MLTTNSGIIIREGVESQGFKILGLLGWVKRSNFDKLGTQEIMCRLRNKIYMYIKQWREKSKGG